MTESQAFHVETESEQEARTIREFIALYGPLSDHPEIENKFDLLESLKRKVIIDV